MIYIIYYICTVERKIKIFVLIIDGLKKKVLVSIKELAQANFHLRPLMIRVILWEFYPLLTHWVACKNFISWSSTEEFKWFLICSLQNRSGAENDDGEDESKNSCSRDSGYIMSPKWGNINQAHWSECSISSMQKFLR